MGSAHDTPGNAAQLGRRLYPLKTRVGCCCVAVANQVTWQQLEVA